MWHVAGNYKSWQLHRTTTRLCGSGCLWGSEMMMLRYHRNGSCFDPRISQACLTREPVGRQTETLEVSALKTSSMHTSQEQALNAEPSGRCLSHGGTTGASLGNRSRQMDGLRMRYDAITSLQHTADCGDNPKGGCRCEPAARRHGLMVCG